MTVELKEWKTKEELEKALGEFWSYTDASGDWPEIDTDERALADMLSECLRDSNTAQAILYVLSRRKGGKR